SGVGITHPFGLIDQAGAIVNLEGNNFISGIVQLNGVAGIGVERVVPAPPNLPDQVPSQLTLTGPLWDAFWFDTLAQPPNLPNLLNNPGAESGPGAVSGNIVEPVPGWLTQDNFTVGQYGTPGLPPGGGKLFVGGPDTASSQASQTVDVSEYQVGIDSN